MNHIPEEGPYQSTEDWSKTVLFALSPDTEPPEWSIDARTKVDMHPVSKLFPTDIDLGIVSEPNRIAIDGANLEMVSDNAELGSRARLSLSPTSTLCSTSFNITEKSLNAPQRSKFGNRRRRPPKTLSVCRQKSIKTPKSKRSQEQILNMQPLNVVEMPLTPPPDTPRARHDTLPKLTIPPSRRPPVQIIVHEPTVSPLKEGSSDILEDPSIRDRPISQCSEDSTLVNQVQTVHEFGIKGLPSPPSTPGLSCNITSPSELDFPELSNRGPSPESELLESPIDLNQFDPFFKLSPSIHSEMGAEENIPLVDAIYSILRSPTDTEDEYSASIAPESALPSAKSIAVYPLFTFLQRSNSKTNSKYCSSCREEKSTRHFVTQSTQRCKHKCTTCKSCMANWITLRMRSGDFENINCPQPNCREILEHEEILGHLADFPNLQNEYNIMKTRSHPHYQRCRNENCRSGQIHDTTLGNLMRCRKCDFYQCTKHGGKWHYGYTCEEFDNQQKSTDMQENLKRISRLLKSTSICLSPSKESDRSTLVVVDPVS